LSITGHSVSETAGQERSDEDKTGRTGVRAVSREKRGTSLPPSGQREVPLGDGPGLSPQGENEPLRVNRLSLGKN